MNEDEIAKEAFQAHLQDLKNRQDEEGLQQVTETLRRHYSELAPSMSPEDRSTGAAHWAFNVEPENVVLQVRCIEQNGSRGACGERMAVIRATPFGHVIEARLGVQQDVTIHLLNKAMRLREDGHDKEAAFIEDHAGQPHIIPYLLEMWDSTRGDVPVYCKRRHGMGFVTKEKLLEEAQSSRRVLNIRPSDTHVV